ncbi:hypothetical protein A9G11_07500 [Gilliamella sp. wkB108]|uniref:hypothetical protein n=1 Tax=Gilliamella sp. wkB108 TaxID=3120256 RepID=UPI00080E54CE|nr:hypothetical protein [Gilliamella apicola]OCG22217.1 hypothetical protein A9G11_07500 [Gilliamella apicola]
MTVIDYWQKLSKRLIIKTALSHLLLGVIATGFSLCQQNALPSESSVSQVGIIAITAIVQENQTATKTESPTLAYSQKQHSAVEIISLNYGETTPSKVVRLSPNNGIRAGPKVTA